MFECSDGYPTFLAFKMKSFLSAYWQNLINLTYRVNPKLLLPDLPRGLELDLLDGKAHVSLVAFAFLDTRVKGCKIPFHINFPEVNLRYYVNCKGKRGVVFLREYVPRYCIALIADKQYAFLSRRASGLGNLSDSEIQTQPGFRLTFWDKMEIFE
ncbi:MAG: DUF2071 domain-containing protein [bacterium]